MHNVLSAVPVGVVPEGSAKGSNLNNQSTTGQVNGTSASACTVPIAVARAPIQRTSIGLPPGVDEASMLTRFRTIARV